MRDAALSCDGFGAARRGEGDHLKAWMREKRGQMSLDAKTRTADSNPKRFHSASSKIEIAARS